MRGSKKRSKTARDRQKIAPATESRKAMPISLSEMPLDILLLIFGWLGPRELLSLALTNRGFRSTLLADNAGPIWKAARIRSQEGPPNCPPDLSEARWAHLLFGDMKCDMRECECNSKFEVPVNFTLCRRVCKACMDKHLVADKKFKKTFPDYDKSILELIPSANAGDPRRFKKDKYKLYWDADIHHIAKQVRKYQEEIRSEKPGAEDALLSFKSARIAHAEYVFKHRHICLRWAEEQSRLRDAERQRLREEARLRIEARKNATLKRFEELGYDPRDLNYLYSDVLKVDAELTEDDWPDVRAALEPIIISRRTTRLERERQALLAKRRRVVEQVFKDYKYANPPLKWYTLPAPDELYEMPEFSVLINDPSANKLKQRNCTHAVEALPSFIAARIDNIRTALLGMLPPSLVVQTASADTDTRFDPLSLVAATFQCSATHWEDGHVLYALEHVLLHMSDSSRWNHPTGHPRVVQDALSFSQAGHDAVISLLASLGWDVHTTTPGELDKLDARFVCMQCPVQVDQSGREFRRALDWRQCVQHYTAFKHRGRHTMAEWMLLNEENIRLVKMHERWNLYDSILKCLHCDCLFQRLDHLKDAVAHVQQMHGIPKPEFNVDYFLPRSEQRSRSPITAFAMDLQEP
ncbi:hypothetical protein WOLCODRAFT_136901 [Wolfiporia cocos MD-104 SS10]|uniref:F-box domain-containing protein n=1 Tax=Wolfiporia cocos (strain MD-104) TaxID=742152 RepID=A0A2H3JF17_WOLCO|nr:hypothetical protein WOLCODRAFT_136901 [Wolfiporia cocos MD-104 SS10]